MSSTSGDKRTYVWAKAKRTCVLFVIGGQEREIQNAQVNFIKVWRQKKMICKNEQSLPVHGLCLHDHFNKYAYIWTKKSKYAYLLKISGNTRIN